MLFRTMICVEYLEYFARSDQRDSTAQRAPLEGVEVKGWMRAWSGVLHGRHLFTVCREERFSLPLYISHAYRDYLSPKNKRFSEKSAKPNDRSRSVSDRHF